MTSKTQAITAGIVSAVSQFLSWLVTVSPDQQNALLHPFVEITPVEWRPFTGTALKLMSAISLGYGMYKAAHSGPQTPPANPPTE